MGGWGFGYQGGRFNGVPLVENCLSRSVGINLGWFLLFLLGRGTMGGMRLRRRDQQSPL